MGVKTLLTILLSTILVSPAKGHPTGAPLIACEQMKPFHPPTTTYGTPPFAVDVSDIYYIPGYEITGELYSTNGSLFRGFLIQGRLADESSTDPHGEFVDFDSDVAHTICGQDNTQGLTHNVNTDKTHVNFTWRAPANASGDIHFKVTVVQSYNISRYWRNIFSPVLLDCSIHPTEGECSTLTTQEPWTGPVTKPTTTAPSPSSLIPFDRDCGYKKGCFPACHSGCKYLVTWHAHDDKIDFQLQMKLTNTDKIWIGVGFSPTGKMDGTSVTSCLSMSDTITVESSHDVGHQNHMFPNKSMGLSQQGGSVNNGIFKCQWTREMKIEGNNLFLDLNKEYYLLVGTGPVAGNGLMLQHIHIPEGSSSRVNFLKDEIFGESTSAKPLIKLHGSLMVIAWVLLSSVGIVASRHCKNMLESKLFLNVKLWFQFHRPVMILAVVCVIAAFVAVFVEIGGFSQISATKDKKYTEAHPYMGIVVTALALINPIMALFRPGADHKRRYIFNWAHFLVGTSCHVTAVVTIYFGLDLDIAKVDGSARYILIIYTAIFVAVEVIFELYRRCKSHKELSKVDQMSKPIVDNGASNNLKTKIQAEVSVSHEFPNALAAEAYTEEKNKGADDNYVLLYMLLVHVFLMVVCAAALVGSICVPATFHEWFS